MAPLGHNVKAIEANTELGSLWYHRKCFLICCMVAVSIFQYGTDLIIINSLQATQGWLKVFGVPGKGGKFVIETTFQQLVTSLLNVGLIVSSVITGPMSSIFDRRAMMVISSIFSVAGTTIQIVVTSHTPLYFGRLFHGISSGIYTNIMILYIAEAAPAHLRGTMVSTYQAFLGLGSIVGSIIANAMSTDPTKRSYQVSLGILYIVPALYIVLIWFIPESPRWLATHNRDPDALKSLRRLRPAGTPESALTAELADIRESIEYAKRTAKAAHWLDIFRGTNLRRTLLVVACAMMHSSSGVNFLVGYGAFFFSLSKTATTPFVNNIIVNSVNCLASFLSLPISRKFGRRPLLLVGFTATTICMFAIAITYTVAPTAISSGRALIALLALFLFGYSTTIGPISFTVAGEYPTNELRSYSVGLGMGMAFVFSWLTAFTTPYFINPAQLNWGAKVTWIWGPSNLISLIFVFFFVPETKGRTLEELDELFIRRVPARQFGSYRIEFDVDSKRSSGDGDSIDKNMDALVSEPPRLR